MNESARFWIDDCNNKWSKSDYSKDAAQKASLSLTRCKNCKDCENCIDCNKCIQCTNCHNCRRNRCCNDCYACNGCSYCCFTAYRNDYANVSLISVGYIDKED